MVTVFSHSLWDQGKDVASDISIQHCIGGTSGCEKRKKEDRQRKMRETEREREAIL